MKLFMHRQALGAALLTLVLAALPSPLLAEAGRVVFAQGKVVAEGADGSLRTLSRRSLVEVGDTIRTSNNSIVQVRMIDRAFIALRSNSEVMVEDYQLGATKEEDSGLFALIRGGFRAISGIIGKRLNSSYRMRTVTGTIGIRGTDYTARLCSQDCQQGFGNLAAAGAIEDGLYVGVNEGAITLSNNLGTLGLDELQYGYIRDAGTAPIALVSSPEFLHFESRPPNPDADQASDDDDPVAGTGLAARAAVRPDSADVNSDDSMRKDLRPDKVEISQEDIDGNRIIDQSATTDAGSQFSLTGGSISSTRMVVSSYANEGIAGSASAVRSNPFDSTTLSEGNLTRFENVAIGGARGVFSRDTTTAIDLGFDPTTRISWGRWYNGSARFNAVGGGAGSIGLDSTSLHWVAGPTQPANIALPSSGSASYQLIGNTTPTDNLGNAGILGNATLNANFSNMTVNGAVAVGVDGRVWNGSASAMPINASGAFNGAMTVDVDAGAFSGAGNAAGFFTNNANGAGLGFAMEADVGGTPTSVTGTAVFQKQ